ncbi:nucleotide exchange factor GrpE [Candidatus Wolfebacteria bacterium]|nr:nucleotide exchange factor GrpE [Candidatus Wolfebacteria bacterium]
MVEFKIMDEDIKKEEQIKNESDIGKCQKEKEEYLDGWKRAKADLINYKKDEAKRFETIMKFGNEALVRNLINVLDSFDLALATLEREGKSENSSAELTMKGIYLIRAQMEDILKQNGLERIIISVGGQFDPSLQEAIASVESDKPAGTILEEVERGYMLHGKLVRPARVKVAK